MTTYIISNNTNGTYRTPSLYINNNAFKIKIVSIFIDKAYYLSNAVNPTVCAHSKQLSKYLSVNNNSGHSTLIFSVSGNGLVNHNIILDTPIDLYFNKPSNVSKFDDFELKSIDGVALNLTTDSVRFQIVVTVY